MIRTRGWLAPLRWFPRQRRGHAADRGSTNIEMAILFPVFVLLILLGIQIANIFQSRNVALAAAQQGAAAQAAYRARPREPASGARRPI